MKLIISNKIKIEDISQEDKEILRRSLTIPNTEYFNNIQFNRPVDGISKYIIQYEEIDGVSYVPRGYLYPLIVKLGMPETIIDETSFLPHVEIPSKIKLKELQVPWVNDMLKHNQGVGVAPPGSGKTIMALDIIAKLGQPALWLTHRQLLADQVIERINTFLDVGEVGLLGDGKYTFGDIITVGMTPTLARRDLENIKERFGVIIMDECVYTEEFVSTTKGYIKAKEVSIGDYVATDNGYGKVEKTWFSFKPSVRVNTTIGVSISCSEDHPVAVYEKGNITYKKAKDIIPGDFVLEKSNTKWPKQSFNKKDYLLGLFVGDGCWPSPNLIRYAFSKHKDNDFWFGVVEPLYKEVYPDAAIKRATNVRGDQILVIKSETLIRELTYLGFHQGRKSNYIPWIFNKINMGSFIGGFFDAEGSQVNGRIRIDNTNYEIIRMIQRFLRDNGVSAVIRHDKKTKKIVCRERWWVQVSSAYNEEFHTLCPSLMERKKQKPNKELTMFLKNTKTYFFLNDLFRKIEQVFINKRTISNITGYDVALFRDINKNYVHDNTINIKDVKIIIESILSHMGLIIKDIPISLIAKELIEDKSRMWRMAKRNSDADTSIIKTGLTSLTKKIIDIICETRNSTLIKNDLDLLEVSNIEDIGIAPVVNFTVEPQHTFFAGGLLTHNCHHSSSYQMLSVASSFSPKYLYGITATPFRSDKMEQVMFNLVGPILVRMDRQEAIDHNNIIQPTVRVRKTGFDNPHLRGTPNLPMILRHIAKNKKRNEMIVSDILTELSEGNICIVLTVTIKHGLILHEMLSETSFKSVHIHSKITAKQALELKEKFLAGEINALFATYGLVAEGFDHVSTNRLFLAGPRCGEALIDQATGRIERTSDGKDDAVIYDYLDELPMMKKQFRKRLAIYDRKGIKVIY